MPMSFVLMARCVGAVFQDESEEREANLRQKFGNDLRAFFDAGEAVVEAGVAIGELVVIEVEQAQDGGVEIAIWTGFSAAAKPNSSAAPWMWPRFTPPPTSQVVKP